MAVPSERDAATCANCGAEVVADQRYCLACGHPVSPVRLAFLDVLTEDSARAQAGLYAPATIDMAPLAYGPAPAPGMGGWLRRNTGLLALLAVLVLCLIAGLLVGHWVTQGSKPATVAGPTTLKVKVEGGGLSSAGSEAAASTATGASSAHAAGPSAKKEKEEEAKEAANEAKLEKAPPPAAVKVSSDKAKKLGSTHGKKHAEEIAALGSAPIEG